MSNTPAPSPRHWHASLKLRLGLRAGKTRLLSADHEGPLRVQRAFYPEGAHCHLYWLHPPGGLVTGDQLRIEAELLPGAQVLLTTPSAGKVYAAEPAASAAAATQFTHFSLNQGAGSFLEWLPQETLVFNGANVLINTRFNLTGGAKLFAWDILCLGRPASGHWFNTGRCRSGFELWQDGRPLQIERNEFTGGERLFVAPWGLNGAHTQGTCLATVSLTRAEQEELLAALQQQFGNQENLWGVTQKGTLLMARYLGRDTAMAKAGFIYLWQMLRPLIINTPACLPRIWAT
jgi:urease accessory protein